MERQEHDPSRSDGLKKPPVYEGEIVQDPVSGDFITQDELKARIKHRAENEDWREQK